MRGQVTIFVVVGIIVMIAFGFVFYLQNMVEDASHKTRMSNTQTEKAVKSGFSNYADICLKRIVDNALNISYLQGGVIYREQNGTQRLGNSMLHKSTDFFGNDVLFNASYWIDFSINNFDEYKTLPPRLCSNTGANRKLVSNNSVSSCETFAYINNINNLQDSLQEFVNKEFPLCINSYDYSLAGVKDKEFGIMNTTVIFSESSLLVTVSYPIKLILPNNNSLSFNNFFHETNTRILPLYNFMYEMSYNMSVASTYSINIEELHFYKEGFEIEIINNYPSIIFPEECNLTGSCTHDLIIVKDNMSSTVLYAGSID